MLKKNVPFVTGFEIVPIPTGLRVKSLQVVRDLHGNESVEILTEDVPNLPPSIIGKVTEFDR